ncbi:hypothetical protein BH11ARM2_BH11ARM2_25830 [soil metagenome]
MRLLLALAAAGVFALALRPAEPVWTVVIGGDNEGHLAPCGCTSPQTGGIRRRASATLAQGDPKHRIVLDTGDFTTDTGPQDRYKAEMLAEAAGTMGAILALTPSEARFGLAELAAMKALSKDGFVSGSAQGIEGVPQSVERGPFAITSLAPDPLNVVLPLSGSPVETDAAAKALIATGKVPVVMLSDDEDAARDLAKKVPGLSLIVHRRGGTPASTLGTENGATLVSPGERGKFVVTLDWRGGRWENYRVIDLGPEIVDDSLVKRMYAAYLQRVDDANLLDRLPRAPSDPFAGNEACLKCHAEAAKVWEGSKHAHAYNTLEHEGHSRDPDCVKCHVVGLEAEGGFRSRAQTPQFAFVGCESCHGPGAAHAINPKILLPRLSPETCLSCHTRDQSPNFDFNAYWAKIKH